MKRFITFAFVVLLHFNITFAENCTDNGSFNIYYGNEDDYDPDINKVLHKLKYVTIQFSELSKYNKYLVLFHNSSIPYICKDLVAPLKDVRKLYFNLVKTTRIEDGAFKDLEYLDELGIYQNQIPKIETGIFNKLNVKKLDIGGNQIEEIDSNAFDDMPNLEYFRIIGNQIKTIDPNWFRNSPKLYDVQIEHNQIRELTENAFKHLRTGSTCKLDEEKNNCPSISLVGNRINKIHPKAFSNLENVSTLILTYNNLKELPNIFDGINIKNFYVEDNGITCFSDDVLKAFEKINVVKVSGNSLKPECAEKIKS